MTRPRTVHAIKSTRHFSAARCPTVAVHTTRCGLTIEHALRVEGPAVGRPNCKNCRRAKGTS